MGTIIHMAVDGQYDGHIVISDVVKPTSRQAIQISPQCLGIVYQNIVVSIGIKLLCLVLIAPGFSRWTEKRRLQKHITRDCFWRRR